MSVLSLRRKKEGRCFDKLSTNGREGCVSFPRHGRKGEAIHALAMRPEILNPLFAALTDLKGVGPQLAKPLTRLGLERVIDVLFHLPTGLISRVPVDRLDPAQAGQTIIVDVTAQDYRSGRSPRSEEHTSELPSLMRISSA